MEDPSPHFPHGAQPLTPVAAALRELVAWQAPTPCHVQLWPVLHGAGEEHSPTGHLCHWAQHSPHAALCSQEKWCGLELAVFPAPCFPGPAGRGRKGSWLQAFPGSVELHAPMEPGTREVASGAVLLTPAIQHWLEPCLGLHRPRVPQGLLLPAPKFPHSLLYPHQTPHPPGPSSMVLLPPWVHAPQSRPTAGPYPPSSYLVLGVSLTLGKAHKSLGWQQPHLEATC